VIDSLIAATTIIPNLTAASGTPRNWKDTAAKIQPLERWKSGEKALCSSQRVDSTYKL
jgi:hypothetical protein